MEMPSRCIGHATKETQHVTIYYVIFVKWLHIETGFSHGLNELTFSREIKQTCDAMLCYLLITL
jgi:hypothetical protein